MEPINTPSNQILALCHFLIWHMIFLWFVFEVEAIIVIALDPVLDPIKEHVDSFRSTLLYSLVSDAGGACVVRLDGCLCLGWPLSMRMVQRGRHHGHCGTARLVWLR
jgi:hypothetical protein